MGKLDRPQVDIAYRHNGRDYRMTAFTGESLKSDGLFGQFFERMDVSAFEPPFVLLASFDGRRKGVQLPPARASVFGNRYYLDLGDTASMFFDATDLGLVGDMGPRLQPLTEAKPTDNKFTMVRKANNHKSWTLYRNRAGEERWLSDYDVMYGKPMDELFYDADPRWSPEQ